MTQLKPLLSNHVITYVTDKIAWRIYHFDYLGKNVFCKRVSLAQVFRRSETHEPVRCGQAWQGDVDIRLGWFDYLQLPSGKSHIT